MLPSWFYYVFSFIFGASIGSFLNVCILRIPKKMSIVAPRSFCFSCKKQLPWYCNIPLLSFIFLRGKCKFCGEPFSIQYFIVELLTALLSLGTWCYFKEPIPYFLYFCLLIAPLVVVSFIDLAHKIIPDIISLPGILVGAIVHLVLSEESLKMSAITVILGILVGGGTLYLVAMAYELLRKQEGLGGGDVKLAAMFGAFFGWKGVMLILLMSSMLGSIIGLIVILFSKRDFRFAIPYGPFLAAAAIIYLFFGENIIRWYLGLF
ncbi:prepilin peptidase [bacterium]|nr:prepilin peptidase [bacterium]